MSFFATMTSGNAQSLLDFSITPLFSILLVPYAPCLCRHGVFYMASAGLYAINCPYLVNYLVSPPRGALCYDDTWIASDEFLSSSRWVVFVQIEYLVPDSSIGTLPFLNSLQLTAFIWHASSFHRFK